jgi:hypothetical protein
MTVRAVSHNAVSGSAFSALDHMLWTICLDSRAKAVQLSQELQTTRCLNPDRHMQLGISQIAAASLATLTAAVKLSAHWLLPAACLLIVADGVGCSALVCLFKLRQHFVYGVLPTVSLLQLQRAQTQQQSRQYISSTDCLLSRPKQTMPVRHVATRCPCPTAVRQ